MISPEHNRMQRLFALLSLGLSDAISSGVMSIDEAERLLYSPRAMKLCQTINAEPSLVDIIHVGTELGAIGEIVGYAEMFAAIGRMRDSAMNLLRDTPESATGLNPWECRLLDDPLE